MTINPFKNNKMEPRSLNIPPDILMLLLIISGAVITILIGVIRNLWKSKDDSAVVQINKIGGIVDTLSKTVNSLEKVVGIMKQQLDDSGPRTEKRLNSHAGRLDEHGERLTKIETRCNIKHLHKEEIKS